MDLVDTQIVFEQRDDKHKWCNKTMPEPQPEPRHYAVVTRRSRGLVCARRTSGQNAQQQQYKHNLGQRGSHRNSSFTYGYEGERQKSQNRPLMLTWT